jgi:hypothetical protein
MSAHQVHLETIECRLILIEPETRRIFVNETLEGHRLPTVHIPAHARAARELQLATMMEWHLHIFVLDFLSMEGDQSQCVVAELLVPNPGSRLKPVEFTLLDLSAVQRLGLESLLAGEVAGPFSRAGWIDEAIRWIQSEVRVEVTSKNAIEQWNGGSLFSLIRFSMVDGSTYWLKGTGAANRNEFAITEYLAGPDSGIAKYLPRLIAIRSDWNAWLMSGTASPLPEIPSDAVRALPILADAVVSLARLQVAMSSRVETLLDRGAFDQRLQRWIRDAPALFEYLKLAMSRQTSSKVPPINDTRMDDLCTLFQASCEQVAQLRLPDSLVHGDLTQGNVVCLNHCQFIDWSEAYVGWPLISLQHLLLLNKVTGDDARHGLNEALKTVYQQEWRTVCDSSLLQEGFRYMSLLAAFSTLYGRGDWLQSSARETPHRLSYARTLARHMDRAVQELEREGASCHSS